MAAVRLLENFDGQVLDPRLRWHCEPRKWSLSDSALVISPDAQTDFWQRTHYGFTADNGHFLYLATTGDFTLSTRVRFHPVHQYDQAGLMVRVSSHCWLKTSVEYEPEGPSQLGAVVTNHGYSDWSTQNFPPDINEIDLRIRRVGSDYFVEWRTGSADVEARWSQIRTAHLDAHLEAPVWTGLYACSPIAAGYTAAFDYLNIESELKSGVPSADRGGPIRVSPDGRYFMDAQGQPFFWLGDTAWPLFVQYTPSEAEAYLKDRAGKGFTVIQGVLAWGGGSGYETPLPGPNYAGEVPWHTDSSQPNETFFQHVDHLANLAGELGLTLAMLPTWGYYISDAKIFNPENARAFGRWLGARYRKQPNIVWVNGGDRIPTRYEAVFRSLAQGLREGDAGAHLITYHPCGWRSSSQFFHAEDWLDFNMIQTWTDWYKIYSAVLSDSLLSPVKPVVLGEGAYENGPEYPLGPITPLVVRRQAWWAFMAGGYFTYGQDQMWRMGRGWVETFNTPAAGHMTLFKSIATSRSWWKRVADQGLFASGVGSKRTLNTAIRSVDGDWAMIYLSSPCHVLIHLDKIATRFVKATWLNPQSGEHSEAGIYTTGNLIEGTFPQGQVHWFSTPYHWEDAVLILDGVLTDKETSS